VSDVLWGVDRMGAVCTLLRDVLVSGRDEWEALAVDDMSLERVGIVRTMKV
jgi:hypothetical protein